MKLRLFDHQKLDQEVGQEFLLRFPVKNILENELAIK
jgi:hypothetical protein